MQTYRVSPAWAARTRFTGAQGRHRLEPVDLMILLRVAGDVADYMPHERGDLDGFEASLRDARDAGDAKAIGLDVHLRAADLGIDSLPAWARSIERLGHACNRDSRCFTSIDLTDGGRSARFDVAGGVALVTAHRAFASRLSPSSIKSQFPRTPFSDRAYVDIDPAAFSGFRSVSSVPVALRMLTWLRSRQPDGLPPDHSVEVDDIGRWTIHATHGDLARRLGITTTRSTLGYYVDLLARVRRDLATLGIDFRAVSEPVNRTHVNWRLRFHLAGAVDHWYDRTDHEGEVAGAEASRLLSRIVRDSAKPSVAAPETAPVECVMAETGIVTPVADTIVPVTPVVPAGYMSRFGRGPRNQPIAPIPSVSPIEPPVEVAAVEPVAAAAPIDPADLPEPTEDHGAVAVAPPPRVPYVYATPDYRVALPPWLRRRFTHRHPDMDDLFADKPLSTPAARERAFVVGVHVWADGLDARPVRIQARDAFDGALSAHEVYRRATYRKDWIRHQTLQRFDVQCGREPDPAWEDGEHGDHAYVPEGPQDDPEAHLPAAQRIVPRDLTNLACFIRPCSDVLGRVLLECD